ncbi:hypothetical protein GCM10011492_08210 [Flexivirga endophytica]|uniref:Uncharacterized protein n=1 Tax=Flexivirga endophytica TaxID=1849103 RepID=A0A916WQD9_9MICO|nr:hypothetical protein [Flexivirga endophytica]GGB20633.1 hypothetical protein GCM10011492_08210 [Flexivirga endophytica]GHB58469.1 hypothetical protein GCM10008112_29230 [Flexivirga endophytica]
MSERREEPDEQTDIDRRFADIIWNIDPSFTIPDTPAPVERSKNDRMDDDVVDASDELAEEDDPDDGDAAAPESTAPLADLPDQWRMPPSGSASLLDDDEADTFVPAPPQPLPSGEDLGFWTMIGCLVGGPAWLLYLFFFDRYAQSLWWLLACALFVAGVVQLIMRSPKNRDDLDDDHGAVL